MSANLHPHWQSTDCGEVPKKSSIPIQEERSPQYTEISRRPAAIVGMLLVVGILSLFFQG